MKKFLIINIVLLLFIPVLLTAQVKKPFIAKDKETIKGIFETIDKSKYRIELGKGQIYGERQLSDAAMNTLRQGKVPVPAIANSLAATYIPATHFWYVITKSKPEDDLESILGTANAARLEAIINKYRSD